MHAGFPGPGTLQLNVVYGTAIRVKLAWEVYYISTES